MTPEFPQDLAAPLTWTELRARAIAAARAKLELATVHAKSVELPGPPLPWDSSTDSVSIIVGSPRGIYWKGSRYFLVDEALDEQRPENRYIAEYKSYIASTGQLRLSVSAEARESLQAASTVRIFRVAPEELELAQHWAQVLEEMDRGPCAVDLWSGQTTPLRPRAPDHLPPDRQLNPGQQRALAAMSTPGGFYVWGPPGTGKTTVITSAVQRAISQGHSVLITSHTNVAVDNVLKSLTEDDSKYGLGIVGPGQVIRHSGKDPGKVLPEVRDHDYLLLEKAAAVLTKRDARIRRLDDELRINEEHQDRDRETQLHDQLIHLEVNIEGVREARGLEPRGVELANVESDLEELRRQGEELDREIHEQSLKVSDGDELKSAIEEIGRERYPLLEAHSHWTDRKQSAVAQLSIGSHELDAARARKGAAEIRLTSVMAQWLPWVKKQRQLAVLDESGVMSDVQARMQSNRETLHQADEILHDIAADLKAVDSRREALEAQRDLLDAAQDRLKKLLSRQHKGSEAVVSMRARERELRVVVGEPQMYADMVCRMKDLGHWNLVADYDCVLARVEKLDQDRSDIVRRRERLADEFEQKKRELLSTAPVLATTLTALSYNTELRKRRFDVVIIDEAASAEASGVIYAAAKADTTLPIVGDFLQNAPIAESADVEDEKVQRERERWRVSDVFALSGITDRESAVRHPRCVALSMQYRYPPIIAAAVNEFCYDGLLESFQKDEADADPVITFLDTSALTGAEFSRVSNSWLCARTVHAAVDVMATTREGSTGYVTPYAPQAKAVQKELRARDLRIEAGTSYKFQGREFETVIFDLMQDDRPRWVSAANLHGSKRAQSAAKLLNVALTRAKKKLFLIGNWSFVRGHDSPGMQALANLEERSNFEVIGIEEYLGGVRGSA